MYKGVRMVELPCFKNKFMEAFLHTFYAVWKARKGEAVEISFLRGFLVYYRSEGFGKRWSSD